MTTPNAPVNKHLATARERMGGLVTRREEQQARHEHWIAQHAQTTARPPTEPETEATP